MQLYEYIFKGISARNEYKFVGKIIETNACEIGRDIIGKSLTSRYPYKRITKKSIFLKKKFQRVFGHLTSNYSAFKTIIVILIPDSSVDQVYGSQTYCVYQM